ncbi:MAG: diacylglycerol kinase family protein [Actinomycetes bacterium]
MTDDLALVVNPASGGGKGRRLAPRVLTALRQAGWRVSAHESRSMDHVEELVAACSSGQTVAVLGGDGTLGRAAAGAFRGGAVLAPLPGGRGNDFCRVLGVPRDPVAAARSLRRALPRRVDTAMAGHRMFVCVAHAGFDSVANDIANHVPVLRGTPVYLYAALRAVVGWTPAKFTVDTGGGPRAFPGWSVAVGNAGQYGGGMRITPAARIDDGVLDVTVVGDITRPDFLRTLPRVYNGSHVQHPRVTTLTGRSVTVTADRPFDVYADGELVGPLPMTMRAMPGALQVLVGG